LVGPEVGRVAGQEVAPLAGFRVFGRGQEGDERLELISGVGSGDPVTLEGRDAPCQEPSGADQNQKAEKEPGEDATRHPHTTGTGVPSSHQPWRGSMGTVIPLTDASRRPVTMPVVTIAIIVANFVVFGLELIYGDPFVLKWSAIPAHITAGQDLITLFTAM